MTDQDPPDPREPREPQPDEPATDSPMTEPLEVETQAPDAAQPDATLAALVPPPVAPPIAPAAAAPSSAPVHWQTAPAGERQTYEVPGAPGVFFAGMWPRFAAWFLDGLLLAIVGGIIGGLLGATTFNATRGTTVGSPIAAIVGVVLSALYFIGSWRSGGRATPGQRLLGIQVGNAFDGQTLTPRQAAIRWAALGYPLGLLSVSAATASIAGLLSFLVTIVLFVTTLGSPTRQGWHDQVANSAVVGRPGRSASTGLAIGIVVGLFLLLVVVGVVVGLALLGSQLSDILSQVGKSV
jgi:uncharacterized RDD family membrane protein YckC